jgi:hypothetical protein
MRLDQAAGLRELLVPRRLRMLPLASVLGGLQHDLLVTQLGAALEAYACHVHELDDSWAWHLAREREAVLALAPDGDSITAAYTFIKAASRRHDHRRFRLLFADAPERFDPEVAAARLSRVADRFLQVEVKLGGVLARDPGHDALCNLAAAAAEWLLPEYPMSA